MPYFNILSYRSQQAEKFEDGAEILQLAFHHFILQVSSLIMADVRLGATDESRKMTMAQDVVEAHSDLDSRTRYHYSRWPGPPKRGLLIESGGTAA